MSLFRVRLNDISSSEDEHIDGGDLSCSTSTSPSRPLPAPLPGGSTAPAGPSRAAGGLPPPETVVRPEAARSRRPEEDRMAAAGSRRPEEDRMAAAGSRRPEEDRMAAAGSQRPEENRMAAAGSQRPEEDRMAAAGPGRLPSRGEDDRERLRMIADLGEDPGIEQLLEQSRVPEEIFIR